MTAPDLDAIRARAEAATPGPWGSHDFGYPGQDEPSSIVIHTGKFDWDEIRDGATLIASTDWDAQPSADAEFIAHAREDVPALLAEVERVRAEAEQRSEERDIALNRAAGYAAQVEAVRGGTLVTDRCTCLHPGWPEAPCSLHPGRVPKTQEEKIEFRKSWDERVDARDVDQFLGEDCPTLAALDGHLGSGR